MHDTYTQTHTYIHTNHTHCKYTRFCTAFKYHECKGWPSCASSRRPRCQPFVLFVYKKDDDDDDDCYDYYYDYDSYCYYYDKIKHRICGWLSMTVDIDTVKKICSV